MHPMLHYVRIAVSVASLVACLLVIALWVRSYETADRLHGRISGRQSFLLASKEGRVAAVVFQWHGAANWWQWETLSYPVDDELSFPVGPVEQYEKALGFGWLHRPFYGVMRSEQTVPDGRRVDVLGAATATLNGAGPIFPYWLLVLLAGACAVTPWIKMRFSLRTLLIATTLVAVMLGLICYAIRRFTSSGRHLAFWELATAKSSMTFARAYLGTGCVLLVAAYGCSKTELKGTIATQRKTERQVPVSAVTQTQGSGVEDTQKHVTEPPSTKRSFYTVDHYDAARNPAEDLASTITRAKAEKKNILIQVGGDWCGWCRLMSKYIETNEKVRYIILDNYLVMKVTENGDSKNAPFLSHYPSIPGYPHLFVLDSDGKLLHSQGTAELEQGHGYNETAYLGFLNKWKPAH